jgi:hypothetical protein
VEEQLSKRERQKVRREARLAAERAAAAKARRTRSIVFAVVATLVLAGVGFAVQRQRASSAAEHAARAAIETKLGQLGCTADTKQPDLGGTHIDQGGPAAVAANPPEKLYPDRPASSGKHISQWVVSGVYDTLIDERPLVHSLEHGWINIYYLQTAPADQVTKLKDWARAQIDGAYPKMIVAPWTGETLPQGANFAYVAWNFRQLCGQFDPEVAQLFARAHSGSNSTAPEANLIPASVEANNRTIFAPTDANLLFPPLDQRLSNQKPNLAPLGAPPGQ